MEDSLELGVLSEDVLEVTFEGLDGGLVGTVFGGDLVLHFLVECGLELVEFAVELVVLLGGGS